MKSSFLRQIKKLTSMFFTSFQSVCGISREYFPPFKKSQYDLFYLAFDTLSSLQTTSPAPTADRTARPPIIELNQSRYHYSCIYNLPSSYHERASEEKELQSTYAKLINNIVFNGQLSMFDILNYDF